MDYQAVKKVLEETLSLMGVSFTDIEITTENDVVRFNILTSEPGLLIGSRGDVVNALDQLVRRMASKSKNEKVNFSVDVNGYRASQIDVIKNKAKILAERARSFQAEVEMEPSSSYERMIVHSLFSKDETIETESRGVGPSRHIVLKPKQKTEL